MKVSRPRGTRDFSPAGMYKRNYVKKQMEKVFMNYNYREILFPVFEHAVLFEVKSGVEIQKHMYVFKDKSGRKMCLRPEATASVCRMFIESLRDYKKPLKLYYFCPMYRYERPQKGRYREFWHMGVELIGAESRESDAEVISIAYKSLQSLGIDFLLEVGHLGILRDLMDHLKLDKETQDKVIFYLDKEDEKKLKQIIKDEVILELVKLRGGSKVLEKAEKLLIDYGEASSSLQELKKIASLLDAEDINYKINLGIARGLEYYTGMVFEIRVKGLGAENQVCGGGRYDNLIELFGGPSTPAVGFAFGFDRVINALELKDIEVPAVETDVLVAPVNSEVKRDALKIASELRNYFVVDFDLMDRKLGKNLEYGSEINAKYAVIVGSEDLLRNEVTLRDMDSGEQWKIEITSLVDELSKKLR